MNSTPSCSPCHSSRCDANAEIPFDTLAVSLVAVTLLDPATIRSLSWEIRGRGNLTASQLESYATDVQYDRFVHATRAE
jgi:hypothetical protein